MSIINIKPPKEEWQEGTRIILTSDCKTNSNAINDLECFCAENDLTRCNEGCLLRDINRNFYGTCYKTYDFEKQESRK